MQVKAPFARVKIDGLAQATATHSAFDMRVCNSVRVSLATVNYLNYAQNHKRNIKNEDCVNIVFFYRQRRRSHEFKLTAWPRRQLHTLHLKHACVTV